MYRRYYSYNDMPQVVHKPTKCEPDRAKIGPCEKERDKKSERKGFAGLDVDDIILGVIILAILLDDSDDRLLIAALAAVFITGMI